MARTSAAFVLNPAARLLWRPDHSVQFELGGVAVVVEGLDREVLRDLIPGRKTVAPEPADDVKRTMSTLHAAGFVLDASQDDSATAFHSGPRLAGDLAALRARHGAGAEAVLAARRTSSVVIHGTGRLAALIAAVLASAGVGHVYPAGVGDVRLTQAIPGGLLPTDESRRFSVAACEAIQRAAPEVDTSPLPVDHGFDLAVIVTDGPVDDTARQTLHARGSPHLVVAMHADGGVVGPLVVPGTTSCLRCADLHRLDRDPAWTALAVQLAVPPRHAPASDVAVATMLAGLAVIQALAYLAGEPIASIDGTLELQLPDYRTRRRSWPPHPHCDCGAHPSRAADSAQLPT